MSAGVAILISVILVTIAWQVGIRNAWGKLGKFLGFLAAVIALVYGLGYSWDAYRDLKSERESKKIALERRLEIKTNGATKLNGVSVGMHEREVLYVLGVSQQIEDRKETASLSWEYDSVGNRMAVVFLGGKVLRVSVVKKEEYGSFTEYGIAFGDNESEVRQVLGESTEPEMIDESGYKILLYGPKHRRLSVVLYRDSVVGMRVGDGTKAVRRGREQYF